ncbi:MAG: hypothetical protein IPO14_09815 [Saprospiraceae bacterium]|nr:hypothetical protein [Saprospiraceae bacterium]
MKSVKLFGPFNFTVWSYKSLFWIITLMVMNLSPLLSQTKSIDDTDSSPFDFSLDAGVIYGLFDWPKKNFNTSIKSGYLRASTENAIIEQTKKEAEAYVELMFGISPRSDTIWMLNAKLGVGGTIISEKKVKIPMYLNIGYGLARVPDRFGNCSYIYFMIILLMQIIKLWQIHTEII